MTAPARSLAEGPVGRTLARLALPILASQMLRLGYQWVDALWVRGLGVEATAAVTTSVFVMWSVYSLNDIVAIGVVAYVSQLLGAGDRARAGVAARRGLTASVALGLLASCAGVFGAGAISSWLGTTGATRIASTRYLQVVLGGAPLPMTMLTGEGIMRAAGDSRTPLLIDVCAVALNAALDPLLIYGLGPFPRLGVAGAAWATISAQGLAAALYLVLALRGHRALPFARRAPGPPVRVRGMMRVGLPAALIGFLFSAVYIAFVRSVAPLGTVAMAVVGVANRLEALLFITGISIGIAGAAMVGQSLGAGRPERARHVIRTGCTWIVWIALAVTAVMMVFPDAMLGLFSRDPALHAAGVPYLRVLALSFVAGGIEMVTAESVLGSGHTVALSWIYGVFSVARIPLAFAVARFGLTGLAWLITVTASLRTVLLAGWAARGTWLRGLGHDLHGAAAPPAAEAP
ncbi:MAG TPA: MATE family efflux transporter [Candidatus Eisenbacteria bacterium]|nr:MATE family efflux transporter [Candidatus Eisenbacteria bacterium]